MESTVSRGLASQLIMAVSLCYLIFAFVPFAGALQIDDEGVDVFVSGKENYPTFRIPSIQRLSNGDLLVFAEGRHGYVGHREPFDVLLHIQTGLLNHFPRAIMFDLNSNR